MMRGPTNIKYFIILGLKSEFGSDWNFLTDRDLIMFEGSVPVPKH